MAKHIDNINRTGVQKKGSTAKSIGIAVAAILGIIVIYCALLVGSVLQAKKHLTQAVSIVQSVNAGSDMTSALPALVGKTAQLQQETKAGPGSDRWYCVADWYGDSVRRGRFVSRAHGRDGFGHRVQ